MSVSLSEEQCPKELLADGNCILAAMGRAAGMERAAKEARKKTGLRRGCRIYRECAANMKVTLVPQRGQPLTNGEFVLHVDNGNEPHCVHLHVPGDGFVYMSDRAVAGAGHQSYQCWKIPVDVARTYWSSGCDWRTMVLFRIEGGQVALQVGEPEKALLDLQAGGVGVCERNQLLSRSAQLQHRSSLEQSVANARCTLAQKKLTRKSFLLYGRRRSTCAMAQVPTYDALVRSGP